jgi:TolB-like protein/DNA-binding winged helix-turn-helix (wHTH) protein/Tfp pilus assembly protein PilF
METSSPTVYEFGEFRLDPANQRLSRRDGTSVPLTPRVFDTLVFMVEHHGTVLDKERLMEAVWPDSIVEENNLSQNISTLRRVFGDTTGSHRFIVTVPGRGYRFAAEVKTCENSAGIEEEPQAATSVPAAQTHSGPEAIPGPSSVPKHNRRSALIVAAAALFLLGVGAFFYFGSYARHPIEPPNRSATPPVDVPAKSIAVLPFENLSEEKENAYFSEGVQDEILTRLSKIADLKVISHTSTQKYKSVRGNVRQIAEELGVAHVLEGSVQKRADEVRVSVQLIDARTDAHLWAETYDRKLKDIFQVETEIAKNIAAKLEAKLTHKEERAVAAQPTTNPAAFELYLKGRYFWNKRSAEDFRKALGFFAQAIELDPNYALAYAGIADTYAVMPVYGAGPAGVCLPLAKAAALKALQFDDSLAEAHASYGGVLCNEYQFAEARRQFERAIELDPNYSTAHHWLGLDILINEGELDRGMVEVRRAQELDPLSLIVNTAVGIAHYRRREYDLAAVQLRKTLELDPNFHLARYVLGQTLDMQGRFDEAISEHRKALQANDDPSALAALGHAYARRGDRDAALKVLEQLKSQSANRFVAAVDFAYIYIALDKKEEALSWLEKGYDDRSIENGLKVDPFFLPLHGEPRFEQLVARVFSEPKSPQALPTLAPSEK